MARPRASAVPPAVDQRREKRLPFFALWFERWKRDLKKVTVVNKSSHGSVQEEEVPRPGQRLVSSTVAHIPLQGQPNHEPDNPSDDEPAKYQLTQGGLAFGTDVSRDTRNGKRPDISSLDQ